MSSTIDSSRGYDEDGDEDSDNKNTQCTPSISIDQLNNRLLPDLDNEVSLNDQGEFEKTIQWSIGSESVIFHYETKYPETDMKCKSTIVTIKKADNSLDVELKIDADNCEGTITINIDKVQEVTNIISESLEHKSEKTQNGNNNTSGCSFPRLSMNNKSSKNGELNPDFDIYYTSEECVPSPSAIKDNVFIDHADSIEKMEEFFKDQIDSVCPNSN